jgi:hypothetical protein
MQAKWDEMFGEKEEVKMNKAQKKAVRPAVRSKKPAGRKTTSSKSDVKPKEETKVAKKPAKRKSTSSKVT